MDQYIATRVIRKTTTTGKSVIDADLKTGIGGQEVIHQNVSIWPNHPSFDTLKEGDTISGEIKTNDRGYTSLSSPRSAGGTSTKRQNAIGEAMDRKEAGIKQHTDNKELAIRMAAACRDATLIIVHLYPELQKAPDEVLTKEEAIHMEWLKWRNYFLANSEKAPF